MLHIADPIILVLRATLIFSILGALAGCGGKSDDPGQKEAETRLEATGHESEQSGKKPESKPELNREEILSARCEHGKPTYTCPECRYEIGVVRIDPALIKTGPASTNGLIRIEKASRQTIGHSIEVTGEVRLNENESAHISPRIDGVIYAIRVDLGARVGIGDILFEIDSAEFGNAVSEYIKFRSLADITGRTFEREKDLCEQEISSEQDMFAARTAYEQNEADLKAAEHKLHVMGVSEQELSSFLKNGHDKQTGRLSVRSPINGSVIEKHATVGELAEVGKDVMLVANLETFWVWLNIYERDLASLATRRAKGEKIPVQITTQSFPDMIFKGEIDYLSSTMNENSRTVRARTIVTNTDGLLRPGMFCKAVIPIDTAVDKALALPKTAILSDEGRSFIFKHLKDDFYLRSMVTLGRENDVSAEILKGLSEGDLVVMEGAFILKSDVLREKMGAGCAD